MFLKDLPIRQRIVRVVMMICTVVLVLMRGAYVSFEIPSSRSNIQANAFVIGKILAANSSAPLAFNSPNDAEILPALKANRHILDACLYNQQGKLFAPHLSGASGYRFDG
jgi:uncharacterized membrane protein affecting hemolysin expression